jgi:hypothetical protein
MQTQILRKGGVFNILLLIEKIDSVLTELPTRGRQEPLDLRFMDADGRPAGSEAAQHCGFYVVGTSNMAYFGKEGIVQT